MSTTKINLFAVLFAGLTGIVLVTADAYPQTPFYQGKTIKIIDGAFNDFNGVIEEVNDEKKKLKVIVKIFGRSTPVELNYMQVEKLS